MNKDTEHLRLLSIFHYVVGAMTAIFSCFGLMHVGMGIAMVFAPETFGPGKNAPPPFFGWLFLIFGSVFVLSGWCIGALMAIAGRMLARRKHHTFCFVVAVLDCLHMPFGTVLGVFTIIVLMRDSVKQLFGLPVRTAGDAPPL
jgi:hypothetical protein